MRLLLAMDDSKHSQAAMQFVASHFNPQKTAVRVVHVVQPLSSAPAPQIAAGYAPEAEADVKLGKKFTEGVTQILSAEGFRAEAAVSVGEARETIVQTAAEWPADLIVVGSHGRQGIERLLIGSVAEFVVRHAPCSVLVVRASEKP